MSETNVWLGTLHYGEKLNKNEVLYLLTNLPTGKQYILDVADIYSGGKSIQILTGLISKVKSNIRLSYKIGLIGYKEEEIFKVKERCWSEGEFAEEIEKIIKKVTIDRMHSIQLHAIPAKDSSLINVIKDIKEIMQRYKQIEVGIANINSEELDKLTRRYGLRFNFVQLHGNIIERRLVRSFSNKKYKKDNIYLIANRALCRGLINKEDHIIGNERSRFNSSKRIQQSYDERKKELMGRIIQVCEAERIKLIEIAYGYLIDQELSIIPIIGGSNYEQIKESIEVIEGLQGNRMGRVRKIIRELESEMVYNSYDYPNTAFEK